MNPLSRFLESAGLPPLSVWLLAAALVGVGLAFVAFVLGLGVNVGG